MTQRPSPTAQPRWSRRSNPERFDAYTRWSLYAVLALEPLLALSVVAPPADVRSGAAGAYLLLSVLHLVTTVRVASAGMGVVRTGGRVPRGPAATMGAVTVLVVVAAFRAFSTGDRADLAYALMVPMLAALAAVATVVTARVLVPMIAVTAAALGLLLAGGGAAVGAIVGAVIAAVFAGAGVAVSMRASVWMLGVVWEQEQRRTVDARLAVAEERLRFSRDLHDVFGRTLSTVAVKSELAAELARRGDPAGVDQMLEVRALAQTALKEVRAVVDGYRAVDLTTELAGARDVLRSAGVRTRVTGDGLALDPRTQEALAWAVREGVTNVVRHANATGCEIDLVVTGREATLVVANDGVRPAVSARAGAGLSGLRERLGTIGGTVGVQRTGDRFELRVVVPRELEDAP